MDDFTALARTGYVRDFDGRFAASRLDLEARVGFEPTRGGFADLSLKPLGYRAFGSFSIAKVASGAKEGVARGDPRWTIASVRRAHGYIDSGDG